MRACADYHFYPSPYGRCSKCANFGTMQSVLMNGVGLMDILINLLGQIDTSEMGKGASASNERIVHRMIVAVIGFS
ncbi:hypothetical protein BLOT_012272 [Blomia tropicalis]|nr:hypothetical protein BLOT_012272 [Blomia tropicalis]